MNNRILIFTDNYPYGKSESFLETELTYLNKSFEIISLFPYEKGRDKSMRDILGKIEIIKPVFTETKKKKELIIKGLFNTSLLYRLIKEGIRSKAWKSVYKIPNLVYSFSDDQKFVI